MVQDLDNFIFANDVIVLVAAGNSLKGVMPTQPYPMHIDDPNWQLGHWAMGYNSMVCGATVGGLSANGVVKSIGWPSPLTRIGPGICDAPVPGFAATGGNCDEKYQFSEGLGVWVCSDTGAWEDHSGTSYAAPMLAREAAFAFQRLQRFCPNDTQPFAVTVKAFLTLTAKRDIPPDTPKPVLDLCERTIGRGYASSDRLQTPR